MEHLTSKEMHVHFILRTSVGYFYSSVSLVLWCRLDLLIEAGLVTKTTVSAGIPTCAQELRPNNIVVRETACCHRGKLSQGIYNSNYTVLYQMSNNTSVISLTVVLYVGLKYYCVIFFALAVR